MEITKTRATLNVHDADLSESRFAVVKLEKASFEDVNLGGARFRDVNLAGATIEDANLAGMTINGLLLTDLQRAFQNRAQIAAPEGTPLEIANTRETLNVHDADLSESRFAGVKLAKASFDDVNLQTSSFTNVNLGGARFHDVNLASATIADANLTGMTINGLLVTDLLRAFENRVQVVLYAKNLQRLKTFYQGVFALQLEHEEPDHAVLAAPGCQLIIVQIPDAIASTIDVADPPRRRTETPIKLVFDVASIAAARAEALRSSGRLDPVEREWVYRGRRVCDGHDPEGNVVQSRQTDPSRRTMAP
jgi:uncharacterized protein YjbI with pentapeptide repeats